MPLKWGARSLLYPNGWCWCSKTSGSRLHFKVTLLLSEHSDRIARVIPTRGVCRVLPEGQAHCQGGRALLSWPSGLPGVIPMVRGVSVSTWAGAAVARVGVICVNV